MNTVEELAKAEAELTKLKLQNDDAQKVAEMYEAGLSLRQIGQALGHSHVYARRKLEKLGISPRPNGGRWPTHGQYHEGPVDNGSGYLLVRLDTDDPMASMRNHIGYVLEHRLVMARKLGRPLEPTETVHHIDGNKKNNAPENLQLLRSTHTKGVAFCCADCGSRNIITMPLEES